MDNIVEFLSQIGRLKHTVRAGWVREQVPEPESVADHSFRAALMALVLGPQLNVNTDKLLRMLLVHDLAESDAAVGDITPYDGIPPAEKHRREALACRRLFALLPQGEDLLALWLEYEEGRTAEAQLAKQLDRFELALQAAEYARQHAHLPDLVAFRQRAAAGITHPLLLDLLDRFIRVATRPDA